MSTEKNKKDKDFNHEVGDLVLVKWDDGMVYFAKIKRVDWRKRQCVVIFDDKSTDKAVFSQIHSGESYMSGGDSRSNVILLRWYNYL